PKSVGLVGAAVISGLLVGWPDRRRVPAVHCRIEPFLYQGGACGVWPGVSARALPWKARPPHAGPHAARWPARRPFGYADRAAPCRLACARLSSLRPQRERRPGMRVEVSVSSPEPAVGVFTP